jgi:hypothetical protein
VPPIGQQLGQERLELGRREEVFRQLYSGANPTGSTSERSPFQSPRRLASLSAARSATSSLLIVFSLIWRPGRAALRTLQSLSIFSGIGVTVHSLRRCVM